MTASARTGSLKRTAGLLRRRYFGGRGRRRYEATASRIVVLGEIVRILFLVVVSAAFVRLTPFLSGQTTMFDFLSNQVVNMGILYAIIVGFLMSITLHRQQALKEYILQEINKIRRIYHLAKHIAEAEPKLERWFERIRASLAEYNDMFRSRSFVSYELGGPLFRKVTYAIYELPSLHVEYSKELYASLLQTAAAATESREFIRSYHTRAISAFQWFVLIVVTVTLSAIIAASTPDSLFSRIVTALVVFNIFLVLDMLYEFDTTSRKTNAEFAETYVHNLPDIDPSPRRKAVRKGK